MDLEQLQFTLVNTVKAHRATHACVQEGTLLGDRESKVEFMVAGVLSQD